MYIYIYITNINRYTRYVTCTVHIFTLDHLSAFRAFPSVHHFHLLTSLLRQGELANPLQHHCETVGQPPWNLTLYNCKPKERLYILGWFLGIHAKSLSIAQVHYDSLTQRRRIRWWCCSPKLGGTEVDESKSLLPTLTRHLHNGFYSKPRFTLHIHSLLDSHVDTNFLRLSEPGPSFKAMDPFFWACHWVQFR